MNVAQEHTTASGYLLAIAKIGVREVSATITDPDGDVSIYDNPASARADFFALTGVEA